ncbi:UNVERIFIED_CONTAM: hypothetical protein HDU68_010672 [Siphonaria sp. JEL0065]|nr:hypothetical protein HDU68_010672 [Siphonaria sp. JEL0065]
MALRLSSSVRRLLSTVTTPAQVVIPQSLNREATWSKSQLEKAAATTGPRFEQTNMALQPNPVAAIDLIAAVPVTLVAGRKASCNGGEEFHVQPTQETD